MRLIVDLQRWRLRWSEAAPSETKQRRRKYLLDQRETGRYCFIHINKCGGTSIEKLLGIPKIHDTALQRREILGYESWTRIFKFAIVRHPYSRLVSQYRYRVSTNQTKMGDEHIGLNEWIFSALEAKDPIYYDKAQMFMPCINWITDKDGIFIVNFLGRLETIEKDWKYISSQIEASPDLPKLNMSNYKSTRIVELDETSKLIIQSHYKSDFDQLNYEK